jgi:hypothetical protein
MKAPSFVSSALAYMTDRWSSYLLNKCASRVVADLTTISIVLKLPV